MTSFKAVLFSMLSILFALSPAAVHAGGARHGTIISLQPIENRGDDENESVHKNRQLGHTIGTGVGLVGMWVSNKLHGRGETAAVVASEAAPAVGTGVAEKIGGPGPTTRFMVKVRLDNKKVLSITQLRQDLGDLKEGDRVVVQGMGDDAKVQHER